MFSFNFLKSKNVQTAQLLNNMTVLDYYDRLKILALSQFEWINLPKECNERFLEETLFMQGKILFHYSPKYGFITLPPTTNGTLNMYNEPTKFSVHSVSVSIDNIDIDDCVMIRNNNLEKGTDATISLFAYRLAESERTIDTNIRNQKTPLFIGCNKNDQLSLKNIFKQYDENETMILGSKDIDLDKIKVFKTDTPFIADKLMTYKKEIWNEAMSFIGVNNANNEKKERMITDEVNANNEQINMMAESYLLSRQKACELINEMYKDKLEKPVVVRRREFNVTLLSADKEIKEEKEELN